MLKLSRLTDYAVVALSHLWLSAPQQKTTSELAQETGLPEPTLAKILKRLARENMVQSRRGIGGGYFVEPDMGPRVTIRQIIEMMEGPIALTTCIEDAPKSECSIASLCPVQGRWSGVNKAVIDVLDNVTLADMQEQVYSLEKRVTHG